MSVRVCAVHYICGCERRCAFSCGKKKKKPRKNLCGGLDVSVIYSTLRIFDFRRAAAWQGNKEKSDEITKVSPGVSRSLPDAS